MKNQKAGTIFYKESKFIQFETERIYSRKRARLKIGYFFFLVGLALLIFDFKMNHIIGPPIPSYIILIGICLILVGVLLVVQMAFIKRDKIGKQLEDQFAIDFLSVKDFDEEMEQYGCFCEDKPIIVTRNFIIEREPVMTKALCLDEVYFITGAFKVSNKDNVKVEYMLYDGKENIEEQTKDGNSRIRDKYFIEFYDEDGSHITDYKHKRVIVKTRNEKMTKEILRDIYQSHPWIYIGREQLYCMKEDNVIEYKLIFDEKKRRYLETI